MKILMTGNRCLVYSSFNVIIMEYKKLWIGFSLVVGISFAVLIYFDVEIYREAPPVPRQVITREGKVLFTGQDIKDGQDVWQSIGGQEVGSIWGHVAYLAPDWSADWLQKEVVFILNSWANKDYSKPFDQLDEEHSVDSGTAG